jgi:hypothetical protein
MHAKVLSFFIFSPFKNLEILIYLNVKLKFINKTIAPPMLTRIIKTVGYFSKT